MGRLQTLYASRCPVCGGKVMPSLAAPGPFDAILDKIAEELYSEKITKGVIDEALYEKTARQLIKAMDEGLGGATFGFEDPRNTLKAYLEQNIYGFSAAKSLTEVEHFRAMMHDDAGNLRSFTEFRNAVIDAGYEFNVNWLQTEYNTALASAQMARIWTDFQANGTAYGEYRTMEDDKVRPEHAALDGLTLRMDSPVWSRIWPPCDWNCRCTVIPGLAGNASNDQYGGMLGKQNVTNPLFEHNSGKDKIIFDSDHPYFNVVPRELDAVKNYGMQTVEKIYATQKLPPTIGMGSGPEYMAWWKDQPKVAGTDDILLRDKSGINILFDSVATPGNNKPQDQYFKDHILFKSNEARWSYAANFPDIVKTPDEVWSQRQGGKIVRFYIKYYSDAPYAVVVKDKAGKMVADSMYQLTEKRAVELRRGVLIYRK